MLFNPCILHDGVFIGPGVVLTNDHNPRSILPNSEKIGRAGWTMVGIEILFGASVGANSVCIAPLKIGRWAMIGAGTVLTKDVPDFALVVGNPGRQIGWVGKTGKQLIKSDNASLSCPDTNEKYKSEKGILKEMASQ